MPKTFNFSNPMQGRKWLRLLHEDPLTGLRIQSDLDLPRRVLGFSFRSNPLGLRGPANIHAQNVVFGTSYAMGFCVDNGQNWYEQCLDESWLNLGLPTGIPQIEALFDSVHRGPRQTALVLFHPNYWVQTRLLEHWRTRGGSIFTAMNWHTALLPCLRIAFRRLRQRSTALRQGKLLIFKHQGVTYHMDALYSRFDFDSDPATVALVLDAMQRMLSRFERVIVIRTLLKQDLVPAAFQNDILRATLVNHQRGWDLVQERLGGDKRFEFSIALGFRLEDYLPRDTHWTESGNEKFARFVQSRLQG